MTWSDYLFSLRGRLNRAKFWLFFAVAISLSFLWMAICARQLGSSFRDFARQVAGHGIHSASGRMAILLMVPLWILFLFPSVAVQVKRLHDRDRSGWWILLFIYGPWLTEFVLNAWGENLLQTWPIALGYKVISSVINFWALLEFGVLRGTIGENRYGPDPLPQPTIVSAT